MSWVYPQQLAQPQNGLLFISSTVPPLPLQKLLSTRSVLMADVCMLDEPPQKPDDAVILQTCLRRVSRFLLSELKIGLHNLML